ncbi:helix-turn-helix protein [Paenibacillus pabuli]|uniref:Helix-turn-helix protein n=1 Tax=Paenibacillus pabuli TaxID=1472 RepID=A0ABX9BKF9_9BACL|nr:helix-turn-helix domain-containing protein [Paenibacillus pabuli]RAI96870.1 helix-turn-helix protein [Paenibacillus pabuli]
MDAQSVRAIRISRNMRQTDFAEALSVSRSCIAAVEGGHRPVSYNLRIRIAQVFGTGDDVITAIQRAKDSDKLAL